MSGVIAQVSEPVAVGAVLARRRSRAEGVAVAADPYTDHAAFYVGQFRPVVRTVYLIRYDREHAEDVTQDAFVQLYLHWSKVARYDAPHLGAPDRDPHGGPRRPPGAAPAGPVPAGR